MQIPYPQRPTYTNDSLSLTPPAPTILQQRLVTPPTSPETFAPPPASIGTTNKRLRNSKSFPLISSTNRVNTSSRHTRVADDKPSPDVFSSIGQKSGQSLRRKQSRGVLRDDPDAERGVERSSVQSTGSTERGLKKKTSFQRTGKQLRLRRTDNSARSLRSEYHLPSNTPPRRGSQENASTRTQNEKLATKNDEESGEEEAIVEGKIRESGSCDVPISDNAGTTPIPRSHSDPLSGPIPLSALSSRTEEDNIPNDSDEETKKYDPKEVFSKERFLNRHSKDFGHLYTHSVTTARREDVVEMEEAVEHLVLEPQIDVNAVRREGREKRRSWALYRAGLVSPGLPNTATLSNTPHSAPAGSTSHSISQTSSGRPGHHRRTSSFLTGAHHPSLASPASAETIRAQPILPRQKVMSGGYKPLALVAVAKATSPVLPGGLVDRTHRTNRWSSSSSGLPVAVVPPMAAEIEDKEEQLSVIDERASEKSRGSIAQASLSDHSRASLSSIPLHLRTHSASTTSSLSSLGAIINNGSPSKSTSSCSSGGEHLGGPRVLSGESFNFRMSVVSGGGRRSAIMTNDHHAFNLSTSESHGTVQSSTSSDGFGNLPTDSRMTLRGGRLLDGQIDPADALLGNDKDSRAARRRARAFLVAGLKLEEGSLFREETSEECAQKMDTTRREGLVIDQPIDLEAAAKENKARKRYSVMRAEKIVTLQPTSRQVGSPQTPSSSFMPLLPPHPIAPNGSGASSASSYHTALDRRISDSPRSEASGDHGFMELLDERAHPADNYRGRESISPITISSEETTHKSSRHAAAAPISTANGITIAVYDPMGHARQASLASFRDSTSERPAPQRDNSEGSSGDLHMEDQGMNSLELERRLFFHPPSNNPTPTKAVRKVKSDFGLGGSHIALPQGRSMSRPTSPVIIHEDSAGASPGRPTKTTWSKGVRQWWREETKPDAENATERGFGHGRGGDENSIPMSVLPPETGQEEKRVNAAVPTPSPLLRERKSWRPFLATLRGSKGRTVEPVDSERVGQLAAPASILPVTAPTGVAMTSTMTLDPPFMEQSLGACSAESTPPLTTMTTPSTTNWLSPLPLPAPLTTRTRDRFSPFSATTFSPRTPEHMNKSPGIMRTMGIQHGQQQPIEQSLRPSLHGGTPMFPGDSRNILSPTPGISPNTSRYHHNTATNRLYQSRQFASESRFDIQKPAAIHLAKAKSLQDLNYTTSEQPHQVVLDEHGRDSRGPLHGLGLHVGWADDVDYKGKAKATSAADEDMWESKLHHQASQLLKLKAAQQSPETPAVSLNSDLGRRPAVGILTNAGSSPKTSPMWQPSPISPDPSHSKQATTDDVVYVNEEVTVFGSVHSTPRTASFTKTRNREYQGNSQMINMHCRELQPAKLLFLLGFLLGPWVWLFGGWGLSPGGYFASSSNGIRLGLSWKHAQAARLRRQVVPDAASDSTGRRPLFPPMSRDEPDKWVKRNRWAAVASAGIFIPAMCVGFATVGALL